MTKKDKNVATQIQVDRIWKGFKAAHSALAKHLTDENAPLSESGEIIMLLALNFIAMLYSEIKMPIEISTEKFIADLSEKVKGPAFKASIENLSTQQDKSTH